MVRKRELFFLDFHHFTAFVEAAVGANCVRQAHLATIRALNQMQPFESMMSAALVPPGARHFSFGYWGHGSLLTARGVIEIAGGCPPWNLALHPFRGTLKETAYKPFGFINFTP